ncbi:hypothetical protein NDU88_003747 [Pleurodeles waltl]|uniref:Uncharacterized protein n=1 Tax=Pleurodeles waltl TaxID=8319 RepID=A0AAV7NHC5_PLEWA|nr:hypothetical protein NDU88_003747 [Pleurodeles waltl]
MTKRNDTWQRAQTIKRIFFAHNYVAEFYAQLWAYVYSWYGHICKHAIPWRPAQPPASCCSSLRMRPVTGATPALRRPAAITRVARAHWLDPRVQRAVGGRRGCQSNCDLSREAAGSSRRDPGLRCKRAARQGSAENSDSGCRQEVEAERGQVAGGAWPLSLPGIGSSMPRVP